MNHATSLTTPPLSFDAVVPLAPQHLHHGFAAILKGRAEELPSGLRIVTQSPDPFGNLVVSTDASDVGAARAAVQPLATLAQPSIAIFSHGLSDDVAAALGALGYGRTDLPAMAVKIDDLAPTQLPPGCEWVRVAPGSADAAAWTAALAEGYALPPDVARLYSPESYRGAAGSTGDTARDEPVRFYAVRQEGRLVATSILCLSHGLAGIYFVCTLPAERRRGLGAHVTAQALREARGLGYTFGVLQSSDDGHPVYLGLGFKDVGRVSLMVRAPAAA